MTFEDAQRAYDNESHEDYEPKDDKCPDCGQRECCCAQLDGLDYY